MRIIPPSTLLGILLAVPSSLLAQHNPALPDSSSVIQPAALDTSATFADALPDAPEPQQQNGQKPSQPDASKQQPKRILGIMPNYRAVSAGSIPPPPGPRRAFIIATQNSFDYSSFVFVGLTSLIAEGEDAHPSLGKGVPGFWAYSWRGFIDKTDGNYWVIFALPTVLHEDERYFAKGSGGIWKRGLYSSSRILIARDYHGHDTINGAELLGRGIAQGISTTYYPSADRSASALASKYGYALLRDAATNTFREFWPDIATHILHRHP
ncbi:MAG TPA: hypothetical protein VG893_15535 [Terracidiphilus sp.]|nr:hypothetical protein [Terracidiphilus sp.]